MPAEYFEIDEFNPQKPYLLDGICIDPKNGSGAVGNTANINYAGFVAFLSPETFLKLCAPIGLIPRPTVNFFKRVLPDGSWCIGPPMLYLDHKKRKDKKYWFVRGHEGRHRATALMELGYHLIPVYMFPYGLRARDIDSELLNSMHLMRDETDKNHIWFEPDYLVFNKKVYARAFSGYEARKLAKAWVRPPTVRTVQRIEPVEPGVDFNYYWSEVEPD